MKAATKLLMLLLTLALSFSLFACGGGGGDDGDGEKCTECVDTNGDGKCDACGEAMPEEPASDITLIENGVPRFNIIYATNIDVDSKNGIQQNVVAKLRNDHGIEVTAVMEGGQNDVPQEIEILVGEVTSRGEQYVFDTHSFGKEGYMIKIIGSKIVIQAGSPEQLEIAILEFADEVLNIEADKIENATMRAGLKSDKKGDEVFYIQDDYRIKNLSVGGAAVNDYTIVTDLENEYFVAAALAIQDEIYDKTGIWLEIADASQESDKSIVIKSIDRIYNEDSFTVKADGTKLVISCAFANKAESATVRFLTEKITLARGDVNFEGNIFKKDISFVTYEDFGAVGDGKTDDYKALYDTHVSANKFGQTVRGTEGATYYLCDSYLTASSPVSIPIKTSTDWNGCTIIIDDTLTHNYSGGKESVNATVENYKIGHCAVFQVLPNDEHSLITFRDKTVLDKIVSDGLMPGTTKVDFKIEGWDGDLMIIPYSSYHNVYRRRGYGQYNGANMHEILIIDKDGNISEETKVMFNYQSIDYIQVYKLDESTAITIEDAKVITMESRIDHTTDGKFQSGYVTRGLQVSRSYTTVKDIEHVVTGGFSLRERAYEGLEGPSQNGFFVASNANHVTFKDCIMPGRVKYNNSSSYNFSANTVNYIVLDGCIQSNFWITVDEDLNMIPSTEWTEGAQTSMGSVTVSDSPYEGRIGSGSKSFGFHWGLGGTNWCKNMEYLNSKISRFDAHQGLYDGRIINTEINDMELTGVGTLEIADVKWYSYSTTTPLLFLRSDYGYTWDGDITLKDVEAYVHRSQKLVISNFSYINWYFGYTSVMPSVAIDNLDLYWFDTHTTVPSGYEITITNLPKERAHLLDSGTSVTLAYNDADKDGFVDEPIFDINRDGYIDEKDDIDLDGDGDKFNTTIKYISEKDFIAAGGDQSNYRKGVTLTGVTANVNIVKPPKYYKILNNDGVGGAGGYVFVLTDTSGSDISDGLWYTDEDTYGGFFGGTKFIYGTGENDFFIGTKNKNGITNTFKFN